MIAKEHLVHFSIVDKIYLPTEGSPEVRRSRASIQRRAGGRTGRWTTQREQSRWPGFASSQSSNPSSPNSFRILRHWQVLMENNTKYSSINIQSVYY